MRKLSKGFTLVEIMIVVAIIAILAAVAIPNFVRYRRTSQMNACIANLKQLQTATEQWRMQKTANITSAVALSDLCGSGAYIKQTPQCPSGGSYNTPGADQDKGWGCSWGASDGTDFEHKLPGYDAAGNQETTPTANT